MPHITPLADRRIPSPAGRRKRAAPGDGPAFFRGLPAALPPSLALWAAAVWPAPGVPR